MFLIIDIYRLGVVYPYLSTSISLDECDYYRYISHIIINVINNDEEIYIAIYLPKKFPDEHLSAKNIYINYMIFLMNHIQATLLQNKYQLFWKKLILIDFQQSLVIMVLMLGLHVIKLVSYIHIFLVLDALLMQLIW